MLRFPILKPPTLEHHSQWTFPQCEEALLAQEEAELEYKYNEIRTANDSLISIGKTKPDNNDQEEFEPDAEDDDAEEESEGEDFEQETG